MYLWASKWKNRVRICKRSTSWLPPFRKTAESPLGLRVIGFKEIEKSAGGNRDIFKGGSIFSRSGGRQLLFVMTSLFAEVVLLRTVFLDGVEIPNINHFQPREHRADRLG